MEDYKILGKLGSGNFATVHLALHVPTSTQVALKLIDKKKLTSPKVRQKVDREISNMEKLRHDNIVEIFESFETPQHTVIVMEYLPNGELFDYVWDRRGLNESEAREMFAQIVEALEHCHKNSLVHRDLKLENILLDKSCRPKLADFGFSREFAPNSTLSTYCGSPLYASPEMIFGKPYLGPECDVWSLGVILYCMLTATMPFDDSNPTKFLQVIQKGQYAPPAAASESARELISRMLDPNPKTRITVGAILSHPWVCSERRRRSVNPLQQQQQPRRRKVNLCYSRSEAAEIALVITKVGGGGGCGEGEAKPSAGEKACVCSCHEVSTAARESGDRKDSVLSPPPTITTTTSPHCESCSCSSLQPAVATLMIHRNHSNCSSGYGSESGSTVFAPRLSVAYAEAQGATRKRSQPSTSPRRDSLASPRRETARSSLVVPPQTYMCEDLVFV